MGIREEGQRRIRTATVGLAAASLIGTAALAVTVATQTTAQATDSTDNGTTDQGGTGFTPPDRNLTNGGTGNGGSFIQPGTGTGNTGTLPHARSGGSR